MLLESTVMETRPYRGEIDHERLSQYFRALSVPARIQLLQKLQLPRTSGEIELQPFRKDRDLSPERVLSRQAVEGHLEKLREVGLVRARNAERAGQAATEYLLNPARLFMLVDEMRRISVLQTAPGLAGQAAETVAATPRSAARSTSARMPEGASVVLVSGPHEGRAFPLEGKGPWVIGRTPTHAVPIPFDPYVSSENAEIRREGDRYVLRDLLDSSNGTMLNWRLLGKGEATPLASGDTIGVGRTLLVTRGLGKI